MLLYYLRLLFVFMIPLRSLHRFLCVLCVEFFICAVSVFISVLFISVLRHPARRCRCFSSDKAAPVLLHLHSDGEPVHGAEVFTERAVGIVGPQVQPRKGHGDARPGGEAGQGRAQAIASPEEHPLPEAASGIPGVRARLAAARPTRRSCQPGV